MLSLKVKKSQVVDEALIDKYIRTLNIIKSKKDLLKNLENQIKDELNNGRTVSKKSKYIVILKAKIKKFTPKYMILLKNAIGEDKFDALIAKERVKFEKDLKKKPVDKELLVELKKQ